MESWVVSGLSQDQLRRRVAKGEIFKIARGLYVRRKPEPMEVAQLLQQRWPKVMIAGKSAVEIYSRTAMTLPLEVAYTNRLSSSEWFKAQRTRQRTFYEFKGIPVQNPILAALEVDEKRAITMLEFHYRSVRGKAALERDLSSISRVPAGTKEMLRKVVHGSDSEAERLVVRALRRRGMKVETNRQIGPYFWDLVVGKIAVEIDGYDFHKAEDLATFIKDRWKANDATLRGYTVLRYSGSCVKHHLREVVQQIVDARQRTPDFSGYAHQSVWDWHSLLVGEPYEPIRG